MTTFKPIVKTRRMDGFYPVYIRVTHDRKLAYIKTNKIIDPSHVTKKGNLTDPVVNEYCSILIRQYNDRLNRVDCRLWGVREVVKYLQEEDAEVCFSDYATAFIDRMKEEGHIRNAKNYRLAVNHLERFVGTNRIMFSLLTSKVLNLWLDSLAKTNRAKEMYPTCVRQIFKRALIELNDEERGVIRIKFNPWLKVQIPKSDSTVKRAISAEACRRFFTRPLPRSKFISPLPELARDVAMLSLCLAGINTVDLFLLKKENYHDGIIAYKRAKTRSHRKDEAYIEMRVEPFIRTIFDKYLAADDDEYLFNFHVRHHSADSFNANVNIGIRKICEDMGMNKEDWYCFYTFRHTWATIAQNDCGANLAEVAFGMNHSQGLNVTRGYIKIDFTPAWELNAKVIDFIFFTDKKSKQGNAKGFNETGDSMFRVTKKMMIRARAYFMGKVVGEVTDIGFNTVEDVIERLVPELPGDIPVGCTVLFRLTNCDTQREIVYERSKGKGF